MIRRWTLAITAAALCLPVATLSACDDDGGATNPCSARVAPSANDSQAIQEAFEGASSGDTICLEAGTYSMARELTLASSRDITLRGDGPTRDAVVLDFAAQTVGNDGITVTSDGFTIENLTLKNTVGDGIVVHADQSTFRNIRVTWDAGSVTENGAYAVYPTDCTRTIVEDCEVSGAADAAIYVGKCEYAIVRRNKVYASVAGIEIENTRFADVYENEVYDNTAGILVFVLPKMSITEGRQVLVRDNHVYDNNRDNFGEEGTVVSFIPKGIGMLVMAAKDVEITDNTLEGNQSAGVMVVSFGIMTLLSGIQNDDPDMDPYAERIHVHGNTFTNNGYEPAGALSVIGRETLEEVLWDGDVRDGGADPMFCLGAAPASFRNFASTEGFAAEAQTTDTTGHECTLDPLPRMTSFADMVPQ